MTQDVFMQKSETREADICWHAVTEPAFALEGLPLWDRQTFCRLPQDLCGRLAQRGRSELAELARQSAGVCLRFCSNAARVLLQVKLAAPCEMYHMAPTGQGGFDCYLREKNGLWQFAGVTNFSPRESAWTATLWAGRGAQREFLIEFPLYAEVREVAVGLPADVSLGPPPPRAEKGLLAVYGTSIDQGACASRPGMCLTAQLSRALDVETVNLGFSGNALFDAEAAEVITRLENLRVLVINAEANAGYFGRLPQFKPFFRRVRKAFPALPVLVLSGLPGPQQAQSTHPPAAKRRWRAYQQSYVAALQAAGDAAVYFVDGFSLWPNGGEEYTVDGLHPTDLGFAVMAQALLPYLRTLLGGGALPQCAPKA